MVVSIQGAESFSGWAGIDHGKPASWNNPNPTSSSFAPRGGVVGYSNTQVYLIGGFDGDDKKVLDGLPANLYFPLNPAQAVLGTPIQTVETAYVRWRGRLKPGFVAGDLVSFAADVTFFHRITVGIDASGFLKVTPAAGAATVTTAQMFTDVDLRIELMARCLNTPSGEWELRVNGVTVGSGLGADLDGIVGYVGFRTNGFHQVGDIVWGHGTGAIADSICTWIETPTVAGRVVRLRTAGLGLNNEWPATEGADVNSVQVDDRVSIMTGPEVGTSTPAPFDDTPAIVAGAPGDNGKRENFRMASLPQFEGLDDGSLSIRTVIQALMIGQDGGGGTFPIDYECLVGGSIYSNPLGQVECQAVLLTPAWRFLPWDEDPDTAAQWTRAGLNSAYFGVRRQTDVGNDSQWLFHQEITVVLGGVLPECGGPPDPINPEGPALAGPCDVKSDSVFTDASFLYDGRNIKHGEPVTETTLQIIDAGSGFDATDTVAIVASEPGTFSAADVGHKFKLVGAGGEVVRVLVTVFSSTDIVHGTLDEDCPVGLQATPTLDWENQINELPIPWLEGESVNVLGDGIPRYTDAAKPPTKYAVASGIVTLADFYGVIVAGLPKIADMEILDRDAEGVAPLRDRKKQTARTGIVLEFTRGFAIGEDAADLATYVTKPITEYPNENPLNLPSKTVVVPVSTRWDVPGRLLIRQVEPLPISVLAIIPETAIGGRGSV